MANQLIYMSANPRPLICWFTFRSILATFRYMMSVEVAAAALEKSGDMEALRLR
jgi:hypothetical protein